MTVSNPSARTAPRRSQTGRHRLAQLRDSRGWSVDAFVESTGLEDARARALLADERLVLEPDEMQAICWAADARVRDLVAYEPAPLSLHELVQRAMPERRLGPRIRIAVCGAGNLGHVFAGLLSTRADVSVRLLASSPARARLVEEGMDRAGGIRVVRRDGDVVGRPAAVVSDAAEAVAGADLVLLALPSHAEEGVLRRIAPHLEDGVLVGSVPGPGGFHWTASRVFAEANRTARLFGLASIPWMCKLRIPGERVEILGTKEITGLAALAPADGVAVADVVSSLLGIPVLDIRNFLQIILNPGNQLLHPGLMYDRWGSWDGTPVAEPPLFYEEIARTGADVLERMGDELLAIREGICAHVPGTDLSAVLPVHLAIWAAYGPDVADPSTLWSTIRTNRAYAGIRTPMAKVDGGVAPDFGSRFFEEDIPYGLVVLRGIADLVGARTPMIDDVIRWSQARMGREYLVEDRLEGADVARSGAPQRFGVADAEALVRSSSGA